MKLPLDLIAHPDALALDRRAATGEDAVRLGFLIGAPTAAVAEYLHLVAALARWLKNAATRAALLAAPDEKGFRALLRRAANR